MLTLLPRNTQILCSPAAKSLLTIPGQPAPCSPEAVLRHFPAACPAVIRAAGNADWILYFVSDDVEQVRQLVGVRRPSAEHSLSNAVASGRGLVLAAQSPVPCSLQRDYSQVLLPFLQRLTTADLVLLPRAALTAAGTLHVADAVLQQPTLLEIFQRGADCSRIPGPVAAPPRLDCTALRRAIKRILPELGRSADECSCIEAGLLLLHDFDAQAHSIVQTMEGRGRLQTADFLHGIMHRREPDPGNAAWWFRRVSRHPAAVQLGANLEGWLQDIGASAEVRQEALQLLQADQRIEPRRMIELAARAHRAPHSTADAALRLVQYLEILNLLTFPA
jgi:hypothetical protein